MRTLHWAWELLAVAWLNIAGVAAEFADNLGKVKPGAYTLVREVIDAGLVKLVGLDDVRDDSSKVTGISRSTHLIEYHLQGVVASRETLHGLHEILSPLRVEPSSANNDMLAARSLDTLFTRQFGLTIYTKRIGFPILLTRNILIALEHIVGTNMNEGTIYFLHCLSQIASRSIIK